jgi:hypothetical protein
MLPSPPWRTLRSAANLPLAYYLTRTIARIKCLKARLSGSARWRNGSFPVSWLMRACCSRMSAGNLFLM